MKKLIAAKTVNGKVIRIPEYNSFACIKARCNNPNNPMYSYYGGRGIKCLYKNFTEFITDIGMSPGKGYTVDRIDNSKNYEPGNCKWATMADQLRNTRRNIRITYMGKEICLKDLSILLNISYGTMTKRYKKGRDLFAPVNEKYRTTGNKKTA